MKYFLTLIVVFLISSVNSQEFDSISSEGNIISMNDVFSKRLFYSNQNEISGSSYLFKNWKNNVFVYSNGETYNLKNINYNIYSNEFSSLRGTDSLFVYDMSKIDSLKINNRFFKKYNGNVIYEVIFEGKKILLLKKYEVKIIEGMFNPIDGTKEKNRFSIMDDYYIMKDGHIEKYKITKKSVLELCSDNQDKVKKYIKKNNLSYKKDSDLKLILKYCEKI